MSNHAPQEFLDHCEYLDTLVNRVDNDGLRMDLIDAIEGLANGLNGDWTGCRLQWVEAAPDDAASLFD
jgi:hypothetical protein